MIGRAPALILVALGLGVIPSMTISCKKEEPPPAATPAATEEDEDKPKKKKKKVEEEEEEAPAASSPAPVVDAGPPDVGPTATTTVKKPTTPATGTGTLTKTDAGTTAPPGWTIPTIPLPSGFPSIPPFPPPPQ